ncbi:GNAT family N-acetyltransferase [Paenibacillus sp. DMB20]|uniref:GNAT family N-acetyltransferase n=1 Tax=Paenibacillus sp. DMB20 TaxID=1642570 RepID=UPI0006280948|nr:GNAT family protein [Paenibacillus sp. DMB20]KKO54642.1 acetyltransferase [Paenibacillus sp. DMB20]
MYSCNGFIPDIAGAGVRLRKLTPGDAEDMHRCWTDEETSRYLFLPSLASAADAEDLILLLNELSRTEDSLRWGVERLDGGEVIGSCGFNSWQLQGAYRGEFGCELASPFWGRGYMGEAAALALDFGFRVMGLNRVEAFSDVRNTRAAAFFNSLGFAIEGTLREYRHSAEGFMDVRVFALLKREWEGKAANWRK